MTHLNGIAANENLLTASCSDAACPKRRLASLDAFRGIAIGLMILVNSPGDPGNVYSLLRHAAWNGWTIADTIFPSFLFMVGVSIVFSLDKRKDQKGSKPDACRANFKEGRHSFRAGYFC